MQELLDELDQQVTPGIAQLRLGKRVGRQLAQCLSRKRIGPLYCPGARLFGLTN
jgi:hypothetical protein